MYDLIIIGAGPAGLFAAHEAATKFKNKKVLIIEKGPDVKDRIMQGGDPQEVKKKKARYVLCGVGGAGGLSDGKLNLNPYIGGNLVPHCDNSEEKAYKLIQEIDQVLMDFGAPKESPFDNEKANSLVERAAKAGIRYIPVIQKHIGSDRLVNVISDFKKFLESKGVEFLLNTKVDDLIIEKKEAKGVLIGKEKLFAKNVIACPGRDGEGWFLKMCEKYDIHKDFSALDVGVRVETKYDILKEVTDINYDPKIHIFTETYDDFVRTFCTNPKGFVVREEYEDQLVGVNGHAYHQKKSENSNFAFLVRVKLTEPIENTHEYGEAIAHLATVIGGRKPILQRLGDLRKGRRSTWSRIKRNFVQPTLTDCTPGDISMALPGRIVTNITEGLTKLDHLISGVASDSTLIYAPEIKYDSIKARVSTRMETNLKNLFAAGDGCGLSGDIINAAATGILATRGAFVNG